MRQEELKQYEVPEEQLPSLWQSAWRYGGGYHAMGVAEDNGWRCIAGWGRDGWDLGSWPYVMVFFRERTTSDEGVPLYDLVTYCEGDITMYTCPSKEIRIQVCDSIAFFYWKHWETTAFQEYETVDDVPAELLGPYRPQVVTHVQE